MARYMQSLVAVLLILPLVKGSSLLAFKEGSASCTGNLTDLEFISAKCPDSDYGCTWDSIVSIFAQVNATQDFPRQSHIVATPSIPAYLPGFSTLESYEATNYTSHYCGSVLQAPSGADAGYSCPEAGFYNYRVTFPMFGDSLAWYGNLYGFSFGIKMIISDAETGDEYATCYAEATVKKGTAVASDNVYTNWGAILGGGAGLLGLTLGYMFHKRKVTTASSEEITMNFELVNDPIMHV